MSATERENAELRTWLLQAAAWAALIAVLWGTDLLAKISERNQSGFGKSDFLLVSEQVTSGLAALVMVLFVVRWLELFPLRRDAWPRALIGHTVGSVLFAFGHFALIVALRSAWYGINGRDYIWRDPFVANLIVEYQKDIKIYLGMVIVITAYGFYRRPRPQAETAPPAPDRLIVQTGSGESVVRFDEIDYLEAARNYIAVHAANREYVVRDTMTNVLEKLAGGQFARTHRSFIVNIDRIREIRQVDSGQRVFLESGADVPLSRSYREAFTKIIGG